MLFDRLNDVEVVRVEVIGSGRSHGPVLGLADAILGLAPEMHRVAVDAVLSNLSSPPGLDFSDAQDVTVGVYSRGAGSQRPSEAFVSAVLGVGGDVVEEVKLIGVIDGSGAVRDQASLETQLSDLVEEALRQSNRVTLGIYDAGVQLPSHQTDIIVSVTGDPSGPPKGPRPVPDD